MMEFTHDEKMLILIYQTGTRKDLIETLEQMKAQAVKFFVTHLVQLQK